MVFHDTLEYSQRTLHINSFPVNILLANLNVGPLSTSNSPSNISMVNIFSIIPLFSLEKWSSKSHDAHPVYLLILCWFSLLSSPSSVPKRKTMLASLPQQQIYPSTSTDKIHFCSLRTFFLYDLESRTITDKLVLTEEKHRDDFWTKWSAITGQGVFSFGTFRGLMVPSNVLGAYKRSLYDIDFLSIFEE